jgi:hypothetical protein
MGAGRDAAGITEPIDAVAIGGVADRKLAGRGMGLHGEPRR